MKNVSQSIVIRQRTSIFNILYTLHTIILQETFFFHMLFIYMMFYVIHNK